MTNEHRPLINAPKDLKLCAKNYTIVPEHKKLKPLIKRILGFKSMKQAYENI